MTKIWWALDKYRLKEVSVEASTLKILKELLSEFLIVITQTNGA